MSRLTATLIFVLMTARALVAADAPPKLEIKNKSSFTMEGNKRNPFWPIGWKPAVRVDSDHVDPRVPASAFLVSSIAMEDDEHFAIINGKIMQEGQEFGLQLNGNIYRIKVKAIRDGKVILTQRDDEIVVQLTRR